MSEQWTCPEWWLRMTDIYGEVADELAAQGYEYNEYEQRWVHPEVVSLRQLLGEAVEWARRPSPLPVVPFREFIEITKAARGMPAASRAVEVWAAASGSGRDHATRTAWRLAAARLRAALAAARSEEGA